MANDNFHLDLAEPTGLEAAKREPSNGRVGIDVYLTEDDLMLSLQEDVRRGLGATPKSLPPVWFYDERGSELFESITRLSEYYPTRAERELLEHHSGAIARLSGANSVVELGAGACDKTRLIVDGLHDAGTLRRYVPFDVSISTAEAADRLAGDYPELTVRAIIGDFHQHLDQLPLGGSALVVFLGGTVGNFPPEPRAKFLFDIAASMDPEGHLLLGTDLVKDRQRLVAAYDDSEGVTAAFNRNVLEVINRKLGADFDPSVFAHVALWNEAEEWIEMRLRASQDVVVDIPGVGMKVSFQEGEELLTEISAKFTPARVESELSEAGFAVDTMWGAEKGDFLLTLAHPAP